MTSRRSVLQLIGLSPVAAPLAAKAARDKAIGELSGITNMPYGAPMPGIGASPSLGQDDWKKKVLRFLAEKAIPEWLDEELRERHKQVGFLDPDIACKRSWSMNVKIATQRERNIEAARRNVLEGTKRGLRTREFEEKWGVWI